MEKYVEKIADALAVSYEDGIGVNLQHDKALPKRSDVLNILQTLLFLIFPGFEQQHNKTVKQLLYEVKFSLSGVINSIFLYLGKDNDEKIIREKTDKAVNMLLESLCDIRRSMKLDVAAAYAGDPAATGFEEVIYSYPGIRAITIQRLAHVLYQAKVPLIPRLMTEYAHSETGIDIHPGAALGEGVFIDHGTGVVIGETASIGNNVRIYQGVTLGALSFPKDACGVLVKGCKRHPTVQDDVVIYAGATILGDITIGKGCVVGGNVWLTEDLPAGSKIIVNPPEHTVRYAGKQEAAPCGKKCPKCS